jgi:hypothetical protein
MTQISTDALIGLIVNFGKNKLEYKRLIADQGF